MEIYVDKYAELEGKIVDSVVFLEDCQTLTITLSDESEWVMYHEQDCCENVWLESGLEDLASLVGQKLLLVESVSKVRYTEDALEDERVRWTYYKFATVKSSATLRWVGKSNGWYSEQVNFEQIGKQ